MPSRIILSSAERKALLDLDHPTQPYACTPPTSRSWPMTKPAPPSAPPSPPVHHRLLAGSLVDGPVTSRLLPGLEKSQ